MTSAAASPKSPGIQSAKTPPPQCPQAFPNVTVPDTFPLPGNSTDTKDCLFLNVFVPRNRPRSKRLPVIAWIHGGGYSLGNASSYDGTNLVRESNDAVVVVSVQYRLGIFDFLSSAKIRENGALNAGLLDQELALQWIQTHVWRRSRTGHYMGSISAGSVLQHVVCSKWRNKPTLVQGGDDKFHLLAIPHALLSVSNVNGDILVDQTTASTEVARLYAGMGTPIEQANRIMGEAIFICPTYFLLKAFPGSFRGENAVPPALHGDDLPHYFPRPFDDPDFSTSFTQSFLDFVLNLDPNVK
ncbi:alpha/beta-hydrolase [Pleurotus eryngii]|uniref:Alpha/beta-hydrolase n=1 Tax=Pleurotus eryngii TaxID=5323 RepID=A0A9P6A4W3_PLEER|nr:alpha/beta-hydrolase [Pleurotus eryngii]